MTILVKIPRIEYKEALGIQKAIVAKKQLDRSLPDALILLEHEPVITLGKRSNENQLLIQEIELQKMNISLARTDRGGLATFHGPGQVVGYPILDLRRLNLKIRDYIELLQKTLMLAAYRLGVSGAVMVDSPGLWLDETVKLGSIGVHVSKGISYHGFSLNINLESNPDEMIVSCGLPDVKIRSLSDYLEKPVSIHEGFEAVKSAYEEAFGVHVESRTFGSVMEMFGTIMEAPGGPTYRRPP